MREADVFLKADSRRRCNNSKNNALEGSTCRDSSTYCLQSKRLLVASVDSDSTLL